MSKESTNKITLHHFFKKTVFCSNFPGCLNVINNLSGIHISWFNLYWKSKFAVDTFKLWGNPCEWNSLHVIISLNGSCWGLQPFLCFTPHVYTKCRSDSHRPSIIPSSLWASLDEGLPHLRSHLHSYSTLFAKPQDFLLKTSVGQVQDCFMIAN